MNKNKFKQYIGWLAFGLIFGGIVVCLSGCNTFYGLGKDISSSSQGIRKAMVDN